MLRPASGEAASECIYCDILNDSSLHHRPEPQLEAMPMQGGRAEDVCRSMLASLHSLLSPLSASPQHIASTQPEQDCEQHALLVLLTAVRTCTAASYAFVAKGFAHDESEESSHATAESLSVQAAQADAARAPKAEQNAVQHHDTTLQHSSDAAQRPFTETYSGSSTAVDQPRIVQSSSQCKQAANVQNVQHRMNDRSMAVLCPAVCEAASAVLQLASAASQAVQSSQLQHAASSQHQESVQKLARQCITVCSDFRVRPAFLVVLCIDAACSGIPFLWPCMHMACTL